MLEANTHDLRVKDQVSPGSGIVHRPAQESPVTLAGSQYSDTGAFEQGLDVGECSFHTSGWIQITRMSDYPEEFAQHEHGKAPGKRPFGKMGQHLQGVGVLRELLALGIYENVGVYCEDGVSSMRS